MDVVVETAAGVVVEGLVVVGSGVVVVVGLVINPAVEPAQPTPAGTKKATVPKMTKRCLDLTD